MEYVLAIGYMESVILDIKANKQQITLENIEEKLNDLLNKDKKIIIAYTKMAFNNIKNSANKVTVREMESQIQYLKDLYTTEELIKRAKNL